MNRSELRSKAAVADRPTASAVPVEKKVFLNLAEAVGHSGLSRHGCCWKSKREGSKR